MPSVNIHPQKSRGGFMILMLIAFTSIILGLATTFYYYCKRGLDDSSTAVVLANQRLALSAALNYIAGRISAAPPPISETVPIDWNSPSLWLGNPFFSANGDSNSIDLKVDGLSRSSRLGWFRVSYAFTPNDPIKTKLQTYFTTTLSGLPADLVIKNCVFVTAGAGTSQGLVTTQDPADWRLEVRSWYLVECAAAPMIGIKRCIPLTAPPQDAPAPGGPIYW